ncbi:hypothetical protein [Aneurinibacillus danicus]|uniref:Uncharacterized protein n=1 Tax=Aneurinibacillus danicus TaxID=267746 RepID=A0A511VAJ5_9BACL|nr:hypothetical protein [Aneurinibacillus danicus]GEN35950.1 hypothetical protein ADA01nite_34100 [Aneurinibacillus danicus]
MEFYGYKFAIDAVLQTIGSIFGSLIGAFLAGLVAFVVLQLQFKNERKTQYIKDLRNFSKVFHLVQFNGLVIIEFMDLILKFSKAINANLKAGIPIKSEEWEAKIDASIRDNLTRLEIEYETFSKINEEHIPHGDLFLGFMSIKTALRSYISMAKTMNVQSFQMPLIDKKLQGLQDVRDHFEKVLNKFADLAMEKEKELKKLDGKGMNYLKE